MPDAPTPVLVFDDVRHHYGQTVAVDGLSMTVGEGEVVCLVGPSGCGKSTTLRLAAGLEELQHGRVSIGGQVVAADGRSLPPEDRNTGMVFQDFALFPHLKVIDNVMFGVRGKGAAEKRHRAERILDQVGMARYAQTFPHELSGGEQQRVALARALAPRPALMLMDEPFSGLDTQLRDSVRDDTLNILAEAGTPTLLVTHDPGEAMRMADRVAVMRTGGLAQVGPPAEIYSAPASLFVARFFGHVNALSGTAAAGSVDSPLGRLAASSLELSGPVTIGIRNEALFLGQTGVPATVTSARVLGPYSVVELALADDIKVWAHVPGTAPPGPDDKVNVDFDRTQAFVFAKE
ncbi:MAG: ABC transporter ATP-binding protein [Alphaproteobacteria bacterium]|nr:ABC transporter ATP-binding protein [Alphaproteobacteria bacterium]